MLLWLLQARVTEPTVFVTYHLRTDFKFIGKVESYTNIFFKVQFLLILHEFVSKIKRFTNLYAKLPRKKNFEPKSWFK